MFENIANIFRIPDLRKRVLFTLGILAVYRLGSQIPTPGVNLKLLAQFFDQQAGSALGLVDLFSGGNLRKLTIFALGIMPYITASIIFQLLTVVYEPLAKLQKEGELGRRKITQWTRYVTVLLGAIQSLAIALTLSHGSGGVSYVLNPGPGFIFTTIVTLTTGTAFIMWLGEQITDRGIGNGMSLLIFAGIVVGLPRGIQDLIDKAKTQAWGSFTIPALVILVVMMIAIVAFIVFVERSERRIPVQYAKRIVGRRLMGGQSTHLPLKVNSGGVMPVIFASSILSAPLLFAGSDYVRSSGFLTRIFDGLRTGEPWYELLYMVGIVFFAYFYISIVFRPDDIADNMRKYGGFIPGIRPGKRTSDFVNDVLTRITLVGALYLIVISLIPYDFDQRHSPERPLAGRRVLRADANLGHPRLERQLLLRRHLAADCGRRGHGYDQPGRVAADHAPLRWLLAAQRPGPRKTVVVRAVAEAAKTGPSSEENWKQIIPGPVLLMGPPGVGKGTQAKGIMAAWGIPQISTGDLLRDHRDRGTRLGVQAKQLMDEGKLVPDDLVNQMVAERLQQPDTARGYILDGYPRTLAQAEWLDQRLRDQHSDDQRLAGARTRRVFR